MLWNCSNLRLHDRGNDVAGQMYFLSNLLDSIPESPQNIDPEIFENFAGHPPAKMVGNINGTNIEFNQPDPVIVGNYIYSWHFVGQIQGNKLDGQLEEKFKNEDKDEATEDTQTMKITFVRSEK